MDTDRLRLDDETQTRLIEVVCHSHEARRAARNQRVAAMNDTLERKSVGRGGAELIYFAGGSGKTPIVLMNALGQGLHYWYRLIDILTRRHRILIWEPRGSDGTQPLGVSDQVDDVEAVL